MTDIVAKKSNTTVQSIALCGIFTALTFVFTAFINIRLPFAGQGGLIHLGNIPLFIAAILFGKKTGAVVGAFGMGLFDLLSGWTAWAPFTFIIVGLMGLAVGAIVGEDKTIKKCALAIVVALVIKVVGYYIAEVILYHNFIAPLGSITGNVLQVGVAGILVLLIIEPLKRAVLNR